MDGVYVPKARITFIAIGALKVGKHDVVKNILRRYDPQASTTIVRHEGKHELQCMLVWAEGNATFPFIDEIRKEVQDVEIVDSDPIVEV